MAEYIKRCAVRGKQLLLDAELDTFDDFVPRQLLQVLVDLLLFKQLADFHQQHLDELPPELNKELHRQAAETDRQLLVQFTPVLGLVLGAKCWTREQSTKALQTATLIVQQKAAEAAGVWFPVRNSCLRG